jgi:hypothetical protein
MPTKRCPPGVFCIENISFTVIIVAFMAFIAIMVYFARPAAVPASSHMMQPMMQPMVHPPSMFQSRANYGVSNAHEDVLLNPYVPPLRDDRASLDIRGPAVMPINVSTQGTPNAAYRQVGILTVPKQFYPLWAARCSATATSGSFTPSAKKATSSSCPFR